jgi:hypothetical protein
MRKLLPVVVILAILGAPSGAAVLPAGDGKNVVIIEGVILDMSPVFGEGMPSGLIPHYRLVKYRVDRVCKGKYRGGEIVIDHAIVSGDELKGREVGDRVYVLAWKVKNEKWRTVHTSPGIRDSAEGIKYLYVGGGVLPATSPSCTFDLRTLLRVS